MDAASFRQDGRAPDATEAMHDLGWILFMTAIWSVLAQMVAIGAALLLDRSETPVLPRALGYVSLWTALLIVPAGLVPFFKDGPFAWNGIVGLYIPITAFTIWAFALTFAVHRTLTLQVAEGSVPGTTRPVVPVLA